MSFSRRNFLKTTAAALGGAAVSACSEPAVSYPSLHRAAAPGRGQVDSPAAHALQIVITHAADESLPSDAEQRVERCLDRMNSDLLGKAGMAIRHFPSVKRITVASSGALRDSGGEPGTVGGVAQEVLRRLPDVRTHVFHFGKLQSWSGLHEDLAFGYAPKGGRCAVVGMDLVYGYDTVYDRYDNDDDLLQGDAFTSFTAANLALHEALHLFDVEHVDYEGDVMTPTGTAGLPSDLDIAGTYLDRVLKDPVFVASPKVQDRLERQWADDAADLGRVLGAPEQVPGGWALRGSNGAVFTGGRGAFTLTGPRFAAWNDQRQLGVPLSEPKGRMVKGELRYVQSFQNGSISVNQSDAEPVVDLSRGLER